MSSNQKIRSDEICTAVTPNTVGAVDAIIENGGEAVGLVVVIDRNTGEMFDAIVTEAAKENHMKLAALIPRQNTHKFDVLSKEEYAELRIKEMHAQAPSNPSQDFHSRIAQYRMPIPASQLNNLANTAQCGRL